ncbi:mechanosensitive ion channel family protein, partial [Candidatus Saccharibacteria bacterium]|nr:mechanosensitive ion channel family protein [Candidatus Saccharibacteria bacterium]
NVHVIPNGEIKVVTNKTNTFANVNLDINLSYDSDIELVEKLANKIGQDMKLDDNWQERIIEPIAFLRISNFGDYSVNVKFLGQVQPGEQWQVAGEFRKRLKLAFDKNNIKIARTQVFLDKK